MLGGLDLHSIAAAVFRAISAVGVTIQSLTTTADVSVGGNLNISGTQVSKPLATGTIIDAKGDLIVGTADNTAARKAVGNNGEVLYAQSNDASGLAYLPLLPKSLAPNPFFQVNQRQVSVAIADDTYCFDRWYVLTEANPVAPSQQTLQENGQATNARLTQSNAVAQRMGLACILEAVDSQALRGKTLSFHPRFRLSTAANVRIAVCEWTSTADAVTSDIVNNWASGTYTPGNFFLAANLNVLGTTSGAPGAATWGEAAAALNVTVGNSCNNLVIFVWTEAAVAQNVTLDIGKVRLVPGSSYNYDIYIPTFEETLRYSQRYFEKTIPYATAPAQNTGSRMGALSSGVSSGTTGAFSHWNFRTEKRASPTIVTYNPQAADANWRRSDNGASLTVNIDGTTSAGAHINSGVAGGSGFFYYIHASAEAEL